jgi:hypothetical protein
MQRFTITLTDEALQLLKTGLRQKALLIQALGEPVTPQDSLVAFILSDHQSGNECGSYLEPDPAHPGQFKDIGLTEVGQAEARRAFQESLTLRQK